MNPADKAVPIRIKKPSRTSHRTMQRRVRQMHSFGNIHLLRPPVTIDYLNISMHQKFRPSGIRPRVWMTLAVILASVSLTSRFRNGPHRPILEESQAVAPPAHFPASKPVEAEPHLAIALQPDSTAALTDILRRLSDPEADIRLAALDSLVTQRLGIHDALPLLIACLNDPEPRIRARAALEVGSLRLAAGDAVPALKQLAFTDTNEVVRSRAKDALYNIRFYDFGFKEFQK
jgi:hypothetical protein